MSKFIGRRIVPKHDGVWDINKEYEELSIVLDKASGESYISRRPVPVGTAISDEIYWMQYSLYSAQIAEAVKEMEDTEARLIQYVDTAESNMNSRVNSAESLTNSNKAELNSRMDTLDKRLDANVSASTDKDKDYERREKAIEWMKNLPAGRDGTVAFLNEVTEEHCKAFLLSITIHSPLKFTVHWFDDTKTEVEMDSNIEDYRNTASYYDGHTMRDGSQRKRYVR